MRLAQPNNPHELRPVGGGLLDAGNDTTDAAPGSYAVHGGFLERSNVDPTIELTQLLGAGRRLEANAQMIRHQDSALGRLIEAAAV